MIRRRSRGWYAQPWWLWPVAIQFKQTEFVCSRPGPLLYWAPQPEHKSYNLGTVLLCPAPHQCENAIRFQTFSAVRERSWTLF